MIYYCESPVGPLALSYDASGCVTGLGFGRPDTWDPDAPESVRQVCSQLSRYFETGAAISLASCELRKRTDFQQRVSRVVCAIPPGQTLEYREVAAHAGSPRGARAVGNVMASNPWPIIVPCHRVVATQGLGGYTGGLESKRWLLAHEQSCS